ncbi:MAG: hypothetical protein R3D71_04020 [Rickettsiales bacterium]
MAKRNTKKENSVKSVDINDIDYIKKITLKLLNVIEQAIEYLKGENSEKIESHEKKHNLLFGSKTSLAATLVTLANLLVELNQISSNEAGNNTGNMTAKDSQDNISNKLSENDIALVEAFVRKLKSVKKV